MNTNAELSQTRPPSRREAGCEPLWRYEDLAPALPPRPLDAESERRPPSGRRTAALHAPAARRPRRSGSWR